MLNLCSKENSGGQFCRKKAGEMYEIRADLEKCQTNLQTYTADITTRNVRTTAIETLCWFQKL